MGLPSAGSGRRGRIVLWVFVPLASLLLIAFGLVPPLMDSLSNSVRRRPPYRVDPAAAALHADLRIADWHCDALLSGRNLLRRYGRGHVDLPRLQQGNVALQVFTVVTQVPYPPDIDVNRDRFDAITPLSVLQGWPPAAWGRLFPRAIYQARRLERAVEGSQGRLRRITSAPELRDFLLYRAGNPRAVGAVLGLEGVQALEGRLDNLDALYVAGFRMIGMCHFTDNEAGGSAHGATRMGLTDFGRRVVRRAEELGMIIDLAHASERMCDDVLDMATRPVVVSHTGLRSVCANNRNLSDRLLRRITAGGGMVAIGYWDVAVGGDDARAIARSLRAAVKLAGPENVALGSDFDGYIRAPFDVSGLALLTEALLAEGFSPGQIRAVMGENTLRFLQRWLPPH